MKHTTLISMALVCAPFAMASAQALQDRAASKPVEAQELAASVSQPTHVLRDAGSGRVHLAAGLFHERRELAKAYLLRLKNENILQNHLLEAGVRIDTPIEQMHQGWESPHCQLRGHFAGHWMSSLAHFSLEDDDTIAKERVAQAVETLKQCQHFNGGSWVGPIPEKYFTILEDNERWVWSPQYTMHKTLMGLYDAYQYTGKKEALDVASQATDWYITWTDELIERGRSEVIYRGECAGMLELWADFYGLTGDERYLTLASRYAMPDLFADLLDGKDTLSNGHANASIPWIHGAARLYEVTGNERYRKVVEAFWAEAVTERGMFASTGNNAGEFWIPKQQFSRFLGSRTQEHCTVYNMIRVAQFLLRWTGEARYADYIERALYNGILAQQNPQTGMVAYFLPTEPGAHKVWGSETHDFWCCDGTMVQAQAMHEDLIYYTSSDGVSISQFIPSSASLETSSGGVRISQIVNWNKATNDFEAHDDVTHMRLVVNVESDSEIPWTLRIRQPEWALNKGELMIDGKPVDAKLSESGFIEITREWKSAQITVSFPKRIRKEALPGDSGRFALLDGPIVLAAICDAEPRLLKNTKITPMYEHLYVEGREWQNGHFIAQTASGAVILKPVYEIADDAYSIYFSEEK